MRTGGPVGIWASDRAGQRIAQSSQALGTSVQAGVGLFHGSPDGGSLYSSDQGHSPTCLPPPFFILPVLAFSARLHSEYWVPGWEKAGEVLS